MSAGGGSHWTGLYIDPKGQSFYYDSFGLAPPLELSQEAQKRAWPRILYSDVPRQIPLEQNCGPRAILFLRMMATAATDAARKKVMAMIGEV